MLIESPIGKYAITAEKGTDNVIVSAENKATLESILDGVELISGALGEDQAFTSDDIRPAILFGKPRHEITLSRAQLTRYFEYEILNFLTYSSLTKMRHL